MNVKKVFEEALAILGERGKSYGAVENNFQRAAALATLKLNKVVTAYDVAVVMESVKDARRATNWTNWDSHIDGVNYRVFATALSGAKPEKKPDDAAPPSAAAYAPMRDPDEPVKRKPGRPRKSPPSEAVEKRRPGRPRKNAA